MRLTAIAILRSRIAATARRFGREPNSVNLIAVSKSRTSSEILALAACGQRLFGENYLQEALPKMHMLAGQLLEWHYIGALQSNKTQEIAQAFTWVHSIDREKIARRLNEHRPAYLPALNVCIQVKLSAEATKSGVALRDLPALAREVLACPRLRLRGLMALPAPSSHFDEQRVNLRALAEAYHTLRAEGIDLDTLSMGTSVDFEAAIAEGATMIRIGTVLFGPRGAA
ncbi:MAG: YggS family pyridoxal phosphate-dependent enzyme [Gammaproteobacteria bacterium]